MNLVVKYKKDSENFIMEGHSAWVYPINHPNETVNKGLAKTSTVISYDKATGAF